MNVKQGVPTKRAASAGSFTNHGGPVVANPTVVPVFWGASWNTSAGIAAAGRLGQFLADLVESSLMTLLAQYGVGAATVAGMGLTDLSMVGTLTDAIIQHRLQAYFVNGGLPEPDGNQVVIIFLDESLGVNDPGQGLVLCEPSGDTAFGYHNFFVTARGNPAYYAVIPALSDLCVTESCQGSPSCTLTLTDSQEQRRTEVTTHEFAEMVTDPQLNAWTDASGNEIGDVCGGQNGVIVVNGRSWTVQTEWDNNTGVCALGSVATPPPPPPPPPSTKNMDALLLNVAPYWIARLFGKA